VVVEQERETREGEREGEQIVCSSLSFLWSLLLCNDPKWNGCLFDKLHSEVLEEERTMTAITDKKETSSRRVRA
jgi:hypothetical protein